MRVQQVFRTCCHGNRVKTFRDLPALPELPVLGHLHLFLPGCKYSLEKLTEAVRDITNRLGPIFRLNLAGSDMAVTVNADDARTLFQNEGRLPIRPTFPALVHYRKKRFGSVGVVPGNGEEWYRFRNGVTPLLKKSVVESYERRHEDVADGFVKYARGARNEEGVLEDVFQHVLKFAVEAISITSPGHRFDCLSKNESASQDIVKASVDFMDGLYEALFGLPLWKIYKTPAYKKLETSHEYIYQLTHQHLETMKTQNDKNPSLIAELHPFLSSLITNPNLSWQDKTVLAMELFLGGIDALATTLTLTLHYLAKHKNVQEMARSDARKNADCRFIKACIKETLRLSPTGGANTRQLAKEGEFSGYLLKEGTTVMAFSSVTSRMEQYFEDADSYRPQRWLRDSGEAYHKFASLPFGHGPRKCPGKRLAEQEMVVFLKRVLDAFELETEEAMEVNMVFRLNRIPDRKINIKLLDTNP